MKRYQSVGPKKKPDPRRPRRSVHKSRLPYWIAKQPWVQKFSRLSRKRKIALAAGSGTAVLVLFGLLTTVYFANSLGSKERIMNRNRTGVTLLDQSGTVIYEFYNARSNTHVPLAEIAPSAREAVMAAEDKDFYRHPGFSPRGITNAVWQNVRPGGSDGGGSTITQQLVATALLDKRRSFVRKYQELILSIEIERRYSKDEVLEMYLNSVYFGEGAFGIEDAAQTYFGVSAKDLTIGQSSMLIGLLPAPSAYSPISGDINKAKVRQNYVLGRMVTDGYITAADKEAALAEQLAFSGKRAEEASRAPHFALMAKAELEAKYGEERIARSGYQVTTGLNLDWQTKAESAVATQVNRLARSNVSNGAAVISDPKTGEIRALVGSKDWNNEAFGKFDVANASRQPGSTFKLFVYATGVENRDFSAATIWQDKATDFGGGYSPQNYDRRFHGDVTTRRAFANSFNIPAVAALREAGIEETAKVAEELGLTTIGDTKQYGLSFALGTTQAKLTEMTGAYAAMGNQGKLNPVTTISSIQDKNGKEIYRNKPANKQAVSDQTAYIMSSILSDNTARAETFGSSLNLSGNRLAAVKTGTTEEYRDAWTIGYTPSAAVGVWIGNNDNAPMSSVAGSTGAAPIWRSLMQEITAGTEVEQFVQPRDITARSICRNNGGLATIRGNGTITEYFRPGTLPTKSCTPEIPRQETTTPVTRPEDTAPVQNPNQTTGPDNDDEPEATEPNTPDSTNPTPTPTDPLLP